MPMYECETHGLRPVVFCCMHVRNDAKAGLACEVDYVFDDYGEGYLVCSSCLAASRQYAREHRSEHIDGYPIELRGQCRTHIQEWCEKMNHVSLDLILKRAIERSRGLPER
jgi:hypothetical protein